MLKMQQSAAVEINNLQRQWTDSSKHRPAVKLYQRNGPMCCHLKCPLEADFIQEQCFLPRSAWAPQTGPALTLRAETYTMPAGATTG